MKTIVRSLQFILFGFVFIVSGCSDQSVITYKSKEKTSIFLSFDEIRSSFKVEPSHVLSKPGKIYVYKDYLFVNELYDGIHVVDNSDPSKPVFLAYIRIAGNTDIAISNDVMYANNGPDLLVIDISNINQISLLKRTENAFFENSKKQDNAYLIGFGEKEVVQKEYVSRGWNGFFFGMQEDKAIMSSAEGAPTQGTGGSMARFALAGNFMYVVNESSLIPIDLQTPSSPSVKNPVSLNRGTIETIFKYKEYLFVGSTNGVFIIDYATNPATPVVLSSVQHFTACDPVVVQNDIAFSTLTAGRRCGGGVNELMVLDVKNASSPIILAEYFLEEQTPLGLAVQDDNLFVCMGDGGINWFKTTDLKDILNNKVTSDVTFNAWDVIVEGNRLIITGSDGIFQYEFNGNSLNKVSTLFSR